MNRMNIAMGACVAGLLMAGVTFGDDANNPCTPTNSPPGPCWTWDTNACEWVFCMDPPEDKECCEVDDECKMIGKDGCCPSGDCDGTCSSGGGKGKMAGGGNAPPSGARSTSGGGAGTIDFRIQLGTLPGENTFAAALWLPTSLPSTSAARPQTLQLLRHARADVDAVRGTNGLWLVFAPTMDGVVSNLSAFAYEIHCYAKGQVDISGAIAPSAVPLVIWRVEDPDAGATGGTRLRLTKFMDGQTNSVVEYESLSSTEMVAREGDGLREERLTWTWPESGYCRIDTHEIRDGLGAVAERTVRKFRHFSFGDRLVEEWKGAEGQEILSHAVDYGEDENQRGDYGKGVAIRRGNGSWIRTSYDLEGRAMKEVGTWLDGETNAPDNESMLTLKDYVCLDSRETPRLNDHRWRTKMEGVAGQWVSTSYRAFYDEGVDRVEILEEASASNSLYGAEGNRRTVRRLNGSAADARIRFKPLSVVHPDGSEDVWQYRTGIYSVSNGEAGVFTEQAGEAFIEVTETLKANLEEPYKSIRKVSVWGAFGREVQTETWVCTGVDQWARMDWQSVSRDDFGRELVRRYANGLKLESTWGCCGKESEIRPDGQSWAYVHDMLGRTIFSIKENGPTEATAYDASGRKLSRTLSGGGLSLSTSNRYDLAGRLVESWDEAGLSTTIDYGERTETVARPGGATETTARFRDGNVKSITGMGVVPAYYEYGIGTDGGQWSKTYTSSTNSPMWQLAVRDREGRRIRTEQPGFGGTVVTNTYEYDDEGRLIREGRTGQLDNLNLYDERGELFRSGTDVNTNGVLDLASMDRIRELRSEYVQTGSNWFQQQTAILYPFDGSANAFTTSVNRTQVGGSGCACEAGVEEAVDARGNVYATQTSVDPLSKTVTKTLTRPGVANPETTVTSNGLLLARTLPTGAEYRYLYDGLGRQVGFVDPRTGTNHTAYLSNGRVDDAEDAAGYRTVFGYDSATGRRISVTDALTNTVHTAYDLQGRATNTWGSTYPVAYEYDAYGRMAAMKTWRDTNGAPDVTRWNYDEATGLLTNKVYANNLGPAYAYDAIGRLAKRIWARGVTNSYVYDALGQLSGIDYSDATPDVAVTFDRLGRLHTVADVLGTRTNVYDGLDLAEERMPDGSVLARAYDALGRSAGISLDDAYAVGYGYDANGRFASVAVSNAVQVEYAYITNSGLLAGWSVADGPAADYAYEPNRDLRTYVANTFDGNPVSSFAYAHDAAGLRTQRVDSGLTTNLFRYNMRSELVDAIMGTNFYAYDYDPIGNRQQASANEVTNLYLANELNQYTNINGGVVVPVYDLDGNMISDGAWAYSWDGENRLIDAQPVATNAGSKLIQFMYDFQGRRIGRRMFEWETFGEIDNWYYALGEYYRYDGWNLLGELGPDVLPRTMVPYLPQTNLSFIGIGGKTNALYVWGLDLSGSLQGAGGVGGLLMQARSDAESTWFYFCDANGNVTDLVDTNGSSVAHYEYDPYGNPVAQTGEQADHNPFRFSSKSWDGETGFYYYGFRFYCPSLGRWINRDPIGEYGGLNLMVFVLNQGINHIDVLGQRTRISCMINLNMQHGHGSKGPTKPGDIPVPPPPRISRPCTRWGFFGCSADWYNNQVPNDMRFHGLPSVPDGKVWPTPKPKEETEGDNRTRICNAVNDLLAVGKALKSEIQALCDTHCCLRDEVRIEITPDKAMDGNIKRAKGHIDSGFCPGNPELLDNFKTYTHKCGK